MVNYILHVGCNEFTNYIFRVTLDTRLMQFILHPTFIYTYLGKISNCEWLTVNFVNESQNH